MIRLCATILVILGLTACTNAVPKVGYLKNITGGSTGGGGGGGSPSPTTAASSVDVGHPVANVNVSTTDGVYKASVFVQVGTTQRSLSADNYTLEIQDAPGN